MATVLENYTVELRGTASIPMINPNRCWSHKNRTGPDPAGLPVQKNTTCETKLTQRTKDHFKQSTPKMNLVQPAELNVIPSGPPNGVIHSPVNNNSTKYYSNVLVEFSATVGDAEAEPEELVVSWTSSLDGDLILTEDALPDGSYLDTSFLSEGEHTITMTVLDPEGNEATESVNIVVGGENQPPSCNITEPNDGDAIGYGDQIILRGTASDPDVTSNMLTAVRARTSMEVNTTTPRWRKFLYGTSDLSGGVHTITDKITKPGKLFWLYFVDGERTRITITLYSQRHFQQRRTFHLSPKWIWGWCSSVTVEWSSDIDAAAQMLTQPEQSSITMASSITVITAKAFDTELLCLWPSKWPIVVPLGIWPPTMTAMKPHTLYPLQSTIWILAERDCVIVIPHNIQAPMNM